jgi:hypothetical protein
MGLFDARLDKTYGRVSKMGEKRILRIQEGTEFLQLLGQHIVEL